VTGRGRDGERTAAAATNAMGGNAQAATGTLNR
jgi:hypothetical protein